MKFKRIMPLALALAIASTAAAEAARLPQNRFSFAVRPSYTQTVSRPSASKPLQSTAANSSYAAQVVSLVNAERARQGLPALTVSTTVQQAAQTRSAAYDTLFEAVCDDLRARCGAAGLHSILAHELIHWLRLMPYKLNKDKKRAPMFYAGLVMVANDLNTWENEGKFDEKARTDRR